MAAQSHDHIVRIDPESGELSIYRLDEDLGEVLYTSVNLRDEMATNPESALDRMARLLGENILLDSPAGREIFGI